MGQPVVLDVFTTGGSGSRQTVFDPGEGIQFNSIHTLSSDLPIGTAAKVSWIIELCDGMVSAVAEEGFFELLFSYRRMFSMEHAFPFRSIHTWWNTTIPQPGEMRFSGRRQEIIDFLRETHLLAFHPGSWKLTNIVELTEAYTGRPFSVLGDWYYRINV